MSVIVVDASVAFKWFTEEPGAVAATALLQGSATLIAPELIVAEVCNAAWRAVRAGDLTAAQRDQALPRLAEAFQELLLILPLAPRALAIATALEHPVYDCFYLALAEQRAAFVVTADRRLLQRIAATPWAGLARDLMAA